jgi:hypothetical protein
MSLEQTTMDASDRAGSALSRPNMRRVGRLEPSRVEDTTQMRRYRFRSLSARRRKSDRLDSIHEKLESTNREQVC